MKNILINSIWFGIIPIVMKSFMGILLSGLNYTHSYGQNQRGNSMADNKGILLALTDYLDGFYDGDTSKIIRSVSTEVIKYGYFRDKNGKVQGEPMSYKEMIGYAASVAQNRNRGKQLPPYIKRIAEILDMRDHTASGKIHAWWGTDYILLEKKNDKWMIRMVLWESSGTEKTFLKEEFATLKWIEGRWKGIDAAASSAFYEEYNFKNDTLILMDALNNPPKLDQVTEDYGRVFFFKGMILHQSGNSIWRATNITSDLIEFEPLQNADNHFKWQKSSNNSWKVFMGNQLNKPDYTMERF